jgi:hypothetical protein
MLVALGALSIGTAIVGGTTFAALAAVSSVTWLVVRGRAPSIGETATLRVFAVGGALAAAGLLLVGRGGGRAAATLVVVGIAVLACLALVRLGAARPAHHA